VKEIKLVHERGVALVDDQDYPTLSAYRWFLLKASHLSYAITSTKVDGKRGTALMHRLIMSPPKGTFIDHINRNGLDNRRENLRPASPSENIHNCRRYVTSKSRFKGVRTNPKDGKYEARLKVNGKRIWLGRYISDVDAAIAYDLAAIRFFGEYALTNVISNP
jgi:hypothetical protein